YDDLFRKASEPYDWDWRLLSAQAFVESRFNSSAVSWAGARGMMQIMPATARAYGVSAGSLSDNKTSVELSLKIIKELDKMLAPKVADPVERRKFIIAAYNSGIAHILDAIALAKVTGRDPQKWNGNVETALLLKSNPEYYNNPVVRYGYFRGRETTDYVRKVTDFYNRAIKSVKA
ncbi:MAG: transglycosylase SLT domain-containing protein, partial [Paramuribaculum sp.]|nr:transglycosylase SLT domain-containing protein [Paramuribaculum sp.]